MPTKKVLSGPGAGSRFSPEEKGEHRPAGGRCIHHAFEAQVARRPDAVAVISGAEALTYAELEARSNRLARALIRRGAGPEVRVGICVERSAELVVGLLGILKAGAAYVPLDPNYPRERIATTLEDARAPLLVAQARFRPLLAGHTEGALWLDADREEIGSESAERPGCRAGSRNLAYLIYTSGSTGRPKGVMIEHASALALLAWCRETWGPEECAGVLGSTSVCFDMSVFEVFHTLALGGKILMADNALALPGLPAREEVTLVNTVPSAAAELVRSGGLPASVRVVNLGGEPLKNALAQALYARGHVESVYNLYGPTEDTTYSTFLRVARGAEREPTVGHAVAGTRVYVLDEGLDPVPGGEAGEVYLGGAGVTRGYLERPELTAERFVPDPFGAEPGGRMYRTGDRVRWRADGELEFLGRVDQQIKIRGFRVELGEIESVLREQPAVEDAAVVALEDEPGSPRLVAYVVPSPGEGLPVGELRAALRAELPPYMVPAAWVRLDALPVTRNGKVDRRALPAPEAAIVEREAGRAPPRSEAERTVAAAWREVLGVEEVGLDDNFFDLGGHSLLLARLRSRLQGKFPREVSIVVLFRNPTVRSLAEHLTQAEARGAPAAPDEAEVEDRRAALRRRRERKRELDG